MFVPTVRRADEEPLMRNPLRKVTGELAPITRLNQRKASLDFTRNDAKKTTGSKNSKERPFSPCNRSEGRRVTTGSITSASLAQHLEGAGAGRAVRAPARTDTLSSAASKLIAQELKLREERGAVDLSEEGIEFEDTDAGSPGESWESHMINGVYDAYDEWDEQMGDLDIEHEDPLPQMRSSTGELTLRH